MEKKYDVKRGTEIYRAIYGSRLKSWILKGRIKREEVVVWRDGLSGWRKPEELEELAPLFDEYEKQELIKAKGPKERIPLQKKKKKKKKKIRNILIIEDEEDLCELLSDALSRRGYNVTTANTKRKGIVSIKGEKPDLVLLDLKLPDGSGMRLLSKIKELRPKTAVIIISAYGGDERKKEARRRGAYNFIDKPFTEEDILRSIRAVSRK